MANERPDSIESEPALDFDSLAVHAGQEPDELTGAVAPPIYQTSTYRQEAVGRPTRGYEYARSQNPTRERLERAVATLEGGRHGIAFASGSATTAAIAELVAPGEEVVVGDDVYGGTFRYLVRVAGPRGVGTRFVDLAGDPAAALRDALGSATRLVWFETPSNPHLKVVDIAAVARAVDGHTGARGSRPLVVVDSTFASPALQRPLALGADVVFHSSTTRTRSAGSRSPTTTSWPSDSASCRTPWARCPGRSTASSSCEACGRWPSAPSDMPPMPRRSRGSSPLDPT